MLLRLLTLRNAGLTGCLMVFLLACQVDLHAQNLLSLDRCIALARENNPRVKLAGNALRAAELSLSELGKTRLPQVTGVGGATFTPVPPKYAYDPAITDGGQLSGQIVVHQSWYDGGIRGLKSDQLRLDLERLARQRNLAEQELAYDVRQAYSEALRSEDETQLREASLTQLVAYQDLVRRLYNGGTANYADLLKSEMQTAMASLLLEKARESVASARLSLGQLTGVPIDSSVSLSRPAAESPDRPPDTTSLANNLEIGVARLLVERGELEIELARHERYPVLSLIADAGYLSSGDNLRLPGSDRLAALGYSVGVGVEIPILNWGATGLRVEQRALAADDLRLQMELLRRSLSTDVRRTSLQLVKAQERLRALRETVRKAEENYLLTKSRYAAGGTLALEVLTAQHLLTDTKMDEIQTQADIRSLAARLERLTVQEQTTTRP
jgi:outer membrane protein